MINITIHYRDANNTPPEQIKVAYTKIRGSFFCVHFMTTKDGPFKSRLIPFDLIDFVEQVDSSKKSKEGEAQEENED